MKRWDYSMRPATGLLILSCLLSCLLNWLMIREAVPAATPSPSPEPSPGPSASPIPPEIAELDQLPPPPPFDALDQLIAQLWMPPLLEALVEMPYVKVRGSDGEKRQVLAGQTFAAGDVFQTSAQGAARVAFDDGSQLLIGGDTAVELDFDAPWFAKGEDGRARFRAPSITLMKGEARILVPNQQRKRRGRSTPSRLRFIVETPHGILGVRGTDFLVRVTETSTQVHVMHGAVEMSDALEKLRTHQGLWIPSPYHAEAFEFSRPFNRPLPFMRSEHLARVAERQPHLQPLWLEATLEHRQKLLRGKLDELRDMKLQEIAVAQGIPLYEIQERTGGRKREGKQAQAPRSGAQPTTSSEKGVDQGTGKPRHKLLDRHRTLLPPREDPVKRPASPRSPRKKPKTSPSPSPSPSPTVAPSPSPENDE